ALTAALLGGAALAAFAPVTDYEPVNAVEAQLGITTPANSGTDKLKTILDGSATYLGLTMGDLKTKLPGTSLGAIANATPGKSRGGLVADLQSSVNAAIDKALAANTITKEQSDKAKADAPGQIAKFVDHVYEQRPAPKTTTRVPKVTEFVGDAIAVA